MMLKLFTVLAAVATAAAQDMCDGSPEQVRAQPRSSAARAFCTAS